MKSTAILASILAAAVHTVSGSTIPKGCYSSVEPPLKSLGILAYATIGSCAKECKENKSLVMALGGGDTCYCGDMLPSKDNKVDDALCDVECQGYPLEICGGKDTFSVLLTGEAGKVPTYDGEEDVDEGSSASPTLTPGSESDSDSESQSRTKDSESAAPTPSSGSESEPDSAGSSVTGTETGTPTGEASGEETGGGGPNMAGQLSPGGLVLGVSGLLSLFSSM